MNWETNKLYLELSDNLNKYGIGPQIIKFFSEFGIAQISDNNLKDNLNCKRFQNYFHNLIPHCKIYPKFEYESHLDKIRGASRSWGSELSLDTKQPLIVLLFVTIDVYDKILGTKELNVGEYFGHEVIDLLFFEAKNFVSVMETRCVVIWIGTRDCLSQESLFNNGVHELPLIKGIEDNKLKQKFIDRSCLDKCITSLLIDYSIDSFEARNEQEACQYLMSIITGLHEVQKRPISSKYKPKNISATNINPWITQLMQIPGLSDDSARGIEKIYKTPKELIRFIKENITKQELSSTKLSSIFENLNGYSNRLTVENSLWFEKLANITYFCSKGFCVRKIGKARARKLVILYGNLSLPSKMIVEPIL